MSIYHDLEIMKKLAKHEAKAHGCNYNIIISNPNKNGEFDLEAGSTYEMVADSFFEQPKPNAILLHKTDDLKDEVKENTCVYCNTGFDKKEVARIFGELSSVHLQEFCSARCYTKYKMSLSK